MKLCIEAFSHLALLTFCFLHIVPSKSPLETLKRPFKGGPTNTLLCADVGRGVLVDNSAGGQVLEPDGQPSTVEVKRYRSGEMQLLRSLELCASAPTRNKTTGKV